MRSKYSLVVLLVVLVGLAAWWVGANHKFSNSQILNPRGEVEKELPYEKYSFDNLAKRGGIPSEIEIVGNKFYYYSEGRRISGEINIPSPEVMVDGSLPVVVMARGYVEKEGYKTGTGTRNAAAAYAKSGYITLAPDFSGYGESDPEDENALGARLVKPVEILDLIASLKTLPREDLSRVYLWGHSNGGQIMISVAEILGKREPSLQGSSSQVGGVTMWAPVTKPFPYNVLYYTDDASDSGKWLRGQISSFEQDYDVFEYSIDRHISDIKIPLQIHQGSADDAVPQKWSDDFVKNLRSSEKDVTYYVYPGADHNMRPSWDTVVTRDLEFFGKHDQAI